MWPEAQHVAFLTDAAADLVALVRPSIERAVRTAPRHLRQVQLQHRPGAGVSMLYELSADLGGGFVGLTTERLPDPVGDRTAAPGPDGAAGRYVQVRVPASSYPGVEAAAGELTVSVWDHPHDPRLPGLSVVSDPELVQARWGRGERLTGLQTVTYRPLRRAVLRAELTTPGPVHASRRIYLKVVRSEVADELLLRHRLLGAARLPVPQLLDPPVTADEAEGGPAGILALTEAAGRPLSQQIMHDGGTSLDPGLFVSLLDALPDGVLELGRRPAWSDRLDRYAHAARTALPGAAERLRQLEARIQAVLDTTDPGRTVPSHGDFYEANVLIDGGRISGLLDVDSLGPGHRVDDYACFLGHLAVLPGVDERYLHTEEALAHFGAAFGADLARHGATGRGLWARAAAVAVSLVAGARVPGAPRETWEPAAYRRLQAAEDLLALARRSGLVA
ncbi:aminoglycoside phosphotransferase family protein [Zhihengliuella sp.]|uniref:aminoglycoside phosphotransferase family protein n=1 Tax=Zhihengliuella sp. TaxID=1954483 RepID=UPI002810A93C|nr:aminoglycoside phosphotransferase family protein [Zhihengliuella sp.]